MRDSARAKDIFLDALELPVSEREAFVRELCAGDRELRQRVEALLVAEGAADSILDRGLPLSEALEPMGNLALGDRVGPYLLEEVLGEGGFGVVVRASQEEPVRRSVALKVLKLGMDTKAVIQRFELERQALALMEHPNIARVYDAGSTEAGRPFFVMELVDGPPITDYCEAHGLELDERLALFMDVCRAVQHAHQRGVLHRDLKPSNVLVATIDGRPQPKVIDFGIAKATGGDVAAHSMATREGFLLGTPSYMSPEQAEGALDIDTRADVYSLGVILYELLAGALPFDTSSMGLAEVFQAIRELEPERPSTRRRRAIARAEGEPTQLALRVDVPPELDWITMRCLAKERDRRYASADALANDVERFLTDQPIEAAPPSRTYRVRKFVRRHRAATTAAVASAAALLVAIVAITVALLVARDANDRLEVEIQERITANAALDASLAETREANQQLDLALVETRLQQEIAELTNAFLIQDLLGAARPTGAENFGPDTPIEELLDSAASELEEAAATGGRYADQPIVEASLRYTIGLTYDTLGLYPKAKLHLDRCVELRRAALPAGHLDTLFALSYAGVVSYRMGAFDEAYARQLEAVEGYRAALGDADRDTLRAISRLSSAMRATGRGDEALAMLEESVAVAEASLDGPHEVTTDLLDALAVVYTDYGRFEDSEALFRRVIEARTALVGERSPVVLNARTSLATVLRATGSLEEAEALYLEVLAVQREVEGPGHPNVLTTEFNLGELMRSQGRLEEALELTRAKLPEADAAFGVAHPRAMMWLHNLAVLEEQLRHCDEAVDAREEIFARYADAHGDGDPRTIASQSELGLTLVRCGHAEEGRDQVVMAFNTAYGERGVHDRATIEARLVMAYLFQARNEMNDALGQFQAGYESAQDALPEGDELRMECGAALSILCSLQGQTERAEELLIAAAGLAGTTSVRAQRTWVGATLQLSHLYDFQDDDEAAAHWKAVSEGRAEPAAFAPDDDDGL